MRNRDKPSPEKTAREDAAIAAMQGMLAGRDREAVKIAMETAPPSMGPVEVEAALAKGLAKAAVVHADALFDQLEDSMSNDPPEAWARVEVVPPSPARTGPPEYILPGSILVDATGWFHAKDRDGKSLGFYDSQKEAMIAIAEAAEGGECDD